MAADEGREKLGLKDQNNRIYNPVKAFEGRLDDRRRILTLELPFKTDTMNLDRASLSKGRREVSDKWRRPWHTQNLYYDTTL